MNSPWRRQWTRACVQAVDSQLTFYQFRCTLSKFRHVFLGTVSLLCCPAKHTARSNPIYRFVCAAHLLLCNSEFVNRLYENHLELNLIGFKFAKVWPKRYFVTNCALISFNLNASFWIDWLCYICTAAFISHLVPAASKELKVKFSRCTARQILLRRRLLLLLLLLCLNL